MQLSRTIINAIGLSAIIDGKQIFAAVDFNSTLFAQCAHMLWDARVQPIQSGFGLIFLGSSLHVLSDRFKIALVDVLFDTNSADLAGTALSMTALANAFKATKARAVLCILDCCFSGQAPARVLDTIARPRNAFVLTGIFAEGRILLAACATNESAW